LGALSCLFGDYDDALVKLESGMLVPYTGGLEQAAPIYLLKNEDI